ncbi:hypothetical protein V8B55DRAFT_1163071 [Mucor lusitanicus]|uniref:Uncharacterized protein n=2 Tax=Mucor circinelloides f. lusitanicus TaxID=29924 RepID=A0A162TS73_MUCCL|nr:hypothetical protein FB192DRAFT_1460665 [Mucor lusitanicus]OAD06692.1 hypothetical protein MUCCIDRAFT_107276 [Mucor lusitanicus CBS 277.49]
MGLEHRDDQTVQMIYDIARNALRNEIRGEETTQNALIDMCRNNEEQYRRIIQAAENSGNLEIITTYARDGIVYNKTFVNRFTQPLQSTMPEPPSLTLSGEPSSSITGQSPNPLREIASSRLSDMGYAKQYYNDYMKDHNRIKWTDCYNDGLKLGFFKSYKNATSLKNTYNAQKDTN